MPFSHLPQSALWLSTFWNILHLTKSTPLLKIMAKILILVSGEGRAMQVHHHPLWCRPLCSTIKSSFSVHSACMWRTPTHSTQSVCLTLIVLLFCFDPRYTRRIWCDRYYRTPSMCSVPSAGHPLTSVDLLHTTLRLLRPPTLLYILALLPWGPGLVYNREFVSANLPSYACQNIPPGEDAIWLSTASLLDVQWTVGVTACGTALRFSPQTTAAVILRMYYSNTIYVSACQV